MSPDHAIFSLGNTAPKDTNAGPTPATQAECDATEDVGPQPTTDGQHELLDRKTVDPSQYSVTRQSNDVQAPDTRASRPPDEVQAPQPDFSSPQERFKPPLLLPWYNSERVILQDAERGDDVANLRPFKQIEQTRFPRSLPPKFREENDSESSRAKSAIRQSSVDDSVESEYKSSSSGFITYDREFTNEESPKNMHRRRDRAIYKEEVYSELEYHVEERPPRPWRYVEKRIAILPESLSPKIARLDWYSYMRSSSVRKSSRCVIDILIEEPVMVELSKRGTNASLRGTLHRRPRDWKAPVTLPPGQGQLPERIRINSSIIVTILATVLGDVAKDFQLGPRGSTVLLRPFKFLIYGQQALRDWCENLEKEFAPTPGNNVNDPAPSCVSGAEDDKQRPAGDELPQSAAAAFIEPQLEETTSEDEIGEQQDDNNKKDYDETKTPLALKHLQCLMEFIDTDISARQAHLDNPTCTRVWFSDLGLLFRPGTEVIDNDGKQAYRVIQVYSPRHDSVTSKEWDKSWLGARSGTWDEPGTDSSSFTLTCIYIDFDGQNLGPVTVHFKFNIFEGERAITSFSVYPIKFHPHRRADFNSHEWAQVQHISDAKKFRQKLILRGTMFLEVASVKEMYYAGPTLDIGEDVESQVMIDVDAAFSATLLINDVRFGEKPRIDVLTNSQFQDGRSSLRREGRCTGNCCDKQYVIEGTAVDKIQSMDYMNSLLPRAAIFDASIRPSVAVIPQPLEDLRLSSEQKTYSVTDDELLIMSYRVYGFILRTRKWAKLDLHYLTDIYPFDEANKTQDQPTFDRLVLEEGHKPMVISLISQHFRDKELEAGQREQFDIIRGKGKGLIILLHGAPGVGKTSTAEAVAELFRKTLFQITCGDLGTTAKEVERALEANFALANKWGCILLLDEADVFLAQRSRDDFARNGLVAVFLRVMEYYSGILFLTTNRIGDFDEAFTSRIHVSLYYPDLNKEKTLKVFDINLQMIQDRFSRKGRLVEIDKVGIGGFAAQHFAEHPEARWNGRQIRNACQTALALAEFEAQGSSHEAILKPDAVVQLTVRHFETVQNAYLHFTKYVNDLYGATSARRAKESRLRAMWVDEDDAAMIYERRKAFTMASSQGPLNQQFPATQRYPQQQQQPLYSGQHQNQGQQFFQAPQRYPPQEPYQGHQQYPNQRQDLGQKQQQQQFHNASQQYGGHQQYSQSQGQHPAQQRQPAPQQGTVSQIPPDPLPVHGTPQEYYPGNTQSCYTGDERP